MGIFKKVKNAAIKKMMTSQMKKQGADDAQIALITELLESNPELFDNMGKEIEARVKAGEGQMEAAQAVMMAHQVELQKLMMKDPKLMQKMQIEAMKMQAAQKKKKK